MVFPYWVMNIGPSEVRAFPQIFSTILNPGKVRYQQHFFIEYVNNTAVDVALPVFLLVRNRRRTKKYTLPPTTLGQPVRDPGIGE